jgi:hypothetical protein
MAGNAAQTSSERPAKINFLPGSLAMFAATLCASSLPPTTLTRLRSFVVQGWRIGIGNTEAVVIYGRFALRARHVIAVQDIISLGAPGI